MKRYVIYGITLICLAILYVQILVIRGFNTETSALNGYSISLNPESRQRFGGLSWGLLRFDLEDKLYIGIIAHIGANQDAVIRLEKDGKTLLVKCRSDQAGICYESFHRDDMKMSGKFRLSISFEGQPSWTYDGKFVRQSRSVLLLKEILLSV
ncbi:hypothetical protein [Sphingomonas sp.]|jgi:hypothetical protein|uniref:hypothetical protein n=1 Tax=Sphingomonas sp. TaxID=28214 RepID=UPI003D6D0276